MKKQLLLWSLLLILGLSVSGFGQKIRKETFDSNGKKRTFYLVVPDSVKADHSVPLLLLLHGSGRNGLTLVEKWKDLAVKEGIIIVGPDAIETRGWQVPQDGPEFMYELLSDLRAKYPIDARRLYIFGHSAGATFGLYMSLLESEYFAATAVHAGALHPESYGVIDSAKRKVPIQIVVGTNDAFFPLPMVRATRDVLVKNGFDVQLTEMQGHTHWYYDKAPKINADAWNFLKQHKLTSDPVYVQHLFK